jgi:hypothetical protein
VLVEDERNAAAMARLPSLSTLVAIARILNGRRALEARYGGKGEIRYAVIAQPPTFLTDAIVRAGAAVVDAGGDRVILPASPASLSAIVDSAFAELAHHVRTSVGAHDMITALRATEKIRRAAPLDREAKPALYWTAVFELAALAGELSRAKGGRWIETAEMPVPFALKFPGGELAMPAKLAQKIVEGGEPEASLEAPQGASTAEPPKPAPG